MARSSPESRDSNQAGHGHFDYASLRNKDDLGNPIADHPRFSETDDGIAEMVIATLQNDIQIYFNSIVDIFPFIRPELENMTAGNRAHIVELLDRAIELRDQAAQRGQLNQFKVISSRITTLSILKKHLERTVDVNFSPFIDVIDHPDMLRHITKGLVWVQQQPRGPIELVIEIPHFDEGLCYSGVPARHPAVIAALQTFRASGHYRSSRDSLDGKHNDFYMITIVENPHTEANLPQDSKDVAPQPQGDRDPKRPRYGRFGTDGNRPGGPFGPFLYR